MKKRKDPHVDRVAQSSELLAVVRVSMKIGRRCVRAYSHAKSPKVFTPPQLLACLILRAYAKTSYRGVIELPAALDVDFGPSSDLKQGYRLVRKAARVFTPQTLYADSGYDSEEWHRQCWEDWGTMSHDPPVVRSKSGEVGGKYRGMMTNKWPGYGKRWDIETVNSAMERSLGSILRARSDTALKREAAIRVLTHAVKV